MNCGIDRGHWWHVNVCNQELVVHSVELHNVSILLLRITPNDGVRILLLRIVASSSFF